MSNVLLVPIGRILHEYEEANEGYKTLSFCELCVDSTSMLLDVPITWGCSNDVIRW